MIVAIAIGVGLLVSAGAFWFLTRKLEDKFQLLSLKALENNNQSFLGLAKNELKNIQELADKSLQHRQDKIQDLVTPVRESLERVDKKIEELERLRIRAESSLHQQVAQLVQTQRDLKNETTQLVSALRAPQVRGRWGELQLKRVVEISGMLEHCDFVLQNSETTETGRLRPDLIVRLPGGKQIIVDAKTPLNSYLDSLQEQDIDKKKIKLVEHARHVRKHIDDLSKKAYWSQFQGTPEFVILFLPGEAFYSAALEQDPSLLEAGVSQNVIVASPTTLISLLRAAAYGWKQEKLTENVRQIGNLGRELFKRMGDMNEHFSRLGKSLNSSVDSYNRAIGSLESRVLVTAKKMEELMSLPDMQKIESAALIETAARMPLLTSENPETTTQ